MTSKTPTSKAEATMGSSSIFEVVPVERVQWVALAPGQVLLMGGGRELYRSCMAALSPGLFDIWPERAARMKDREREKKKKNMEERERKAKWVCLFHVWLDIQQEKDGQKGWKGGGVKRK